jgi:hypothetical protein
MDIFVSYLFSPDNLTIRGELADTLFERKKGINSVADKNKSIDIFFLSILAS